MASDPLTANRMSKFLSASKVSILIHVDMNEQGLISNEIHLPLCKV